MKKFSLIFSSILFGLLCFLLILKSGNYISPDQLQLFLLAAPAIVFPILILLHTNSHNGMTNIFFVLISSIIYHSAGWVSTSFEIFGYSFIAGGIWGALLLLTAIKYFLHYSITWVNILLGGLIGGLAFTPFYYYHSQETGFAFSFLGWISFVGMYINSLLNKKS
jgi:hypothetical protein